MKNRILTLALACVTALAAPASFVVHAQPGQSLTDEGAFAAKADKLLKRIRVKADEVRSAPAGRERQRAEEELDALSKVTPVRRDAQGRVSAGMLVRLSGYGASELKAAGFAVGAVVGDIATVEADAERLPELAALASVRKMWASTYRYPVNDRARQSVGIDNLSGQRVVAQTGSGVVVGIIDSGIDFRHKDFTLPGSNGTRTRIKFLLDMTAYGGSTAGWDYILPGGTSRVGKLYTEADINAALAQPKPADQSTDLVKERDKNGHGTHVTGTAAGNGLAAGTSSNVYAGMAPQADLIIVKASRQDNGDASFRDDDEINGLQFIQTKAAELNEPFVINMSLGGQLGPHDGTGPDERVIDTIVNGGAGRAVCIAAGNEGSDSIHAQTTVPAGGTISLDFNANTNPQFIDLYYKNSDRFRVTVTKPDGTSLPTVNFSATGFDSSSGQASDSTVQVWNALDDKGDNDASNDQPDIFLVFKSGAPTGTWHLTIQDADSNANSSLDAWAVGDDVSFADFVDNNSHLVGSPGTARGAITVGAYVTRSASQTIGNFAPFTSPGPTADGRQKPEISAPGYYLYSTRSSDTVDTSIFTYGANDSRCQCALTAGVDQSLYGGLAGTSMATPVVTGSAALLFQANRNLTSDQVKQLIENNSAHDQFDPAGWDARFGFGKLNVASAIATLAPPPPSNPIDDPTFYVTQHYRDFLNREPDAAGLSFWVNQITSCGTNQGCLDAKRINVSAAFFLSIEFQNTGYLVERMYKAAYGDMTETSTGLVVPIIRRSEFLADIPVISNGIIVGQGDWAAQLDANKNVYAAAFVQRQRFTSAFPLTMTPAQFVDKLNANAGGVLDATERANLVGALTANNTNAGRASVLRKVAEDADLDSREKNRAFVLMEYYGYLQRNPNDAPEANLNFAGWNFWLAKLNQFNGDFVKAEMVKAFISSDEYRHRFGQ